MKKILNWVLAATLTISGASVFTSCNNDTSDNPSKEQAKKNRKEFVQHTRATMKDLAENLNFTSWEGANMLNKYFNQYVLNNSDFNKAVIAAFMQKTMQSIKPVEEGSQLAEMGFAMYATIDLMDFNYRFTMNADNTGFDIEEADDFEVIVNAFNPETSELQPAMLKLTLKASGGPSFKHIVHAREMEGLALVIIVPTDFQFAIADKFSGAWIDGFTGSFKNEANLQDGAEYLDVFKDSWTISGTINSYMQAVPSMQAEADATTLKFLVSDNPTTKEIKREFSFVQNGRNMLSFTASGRSEYGIKLPGADPAMGEILDLPDMGEGPEKPDHDGDGEPDAPPTTSNSDSWLTSLLINLVAGKSFDKLSLTLLDDLTTTMSISNCSRALQLAQEAAQARRRYADEATIDRYTQQLNELIEAEMTCKGVNQTIPMRLVTTKFGVDYWTMPAFNFADENGYVSFVDLLDAESVAYGINIIDHAVNPMQQSIIIVRQLVQYVLGISNSLQQSQDKQQ